MRKSIYTLAGLVVLTLLKASFLMAQNISDKSSYLQVNTYVNPVLPGDQPDPTLLKVGDDFYHCGSTFHFNPYMPVYHSRDLVHWEVIGRVLPPLKAGWNTVDTRLSKYQKGIHNLVVVLKGNNPVEVDWIQFVN